MKKIVIMMFAAVLLAVSVTGCNTVRGAGEDIEHTGDAIQRTVD